MTHEFGSKLEEDYGWIGFDLDGTLSIYDEWKGLEHIGEPIEPMMKLAKLYQLEGYEIKIMTARASDPLQIPSVKAWALLHGLGDIEVTCCKDFRMRMLYDDRCIQVEFNTGRIITDG